MKNAYLQIPLHREDMHAIYSVRSKRTTFGVHQTSLRGHKRCSGISTRNAAFVHWHNLKRTQAYFDDVIFGGRSEVKHQDNPRNFLKTAETWGPTLNKAKFSFVCKKVPMLSHIVEAGSECPDPSRIKTLMVFLIPENSTPLKQFLGFYAYNSLVLQTTQIRMPLYSQHRNNWRFR